MLIAMKCGNTIPKNLKPFTRRIQENRLEGIDGQLFLKLRSLQILDLSHNRISDLPTEVFQSIYHVRVMKVSNNKLRHLPNLQEQTELSELDVSKNEIHSISHDDLRQLRRLKTLQLSENFIGDEFKFQ